jgi:hypothetical protein
VIRVNDLVADLVVHIFWLPPRKQNQYRAMCCKSQGISIEMKRLEKSQCKFGSRIAMERLNRERTRQVNGKGLGTQRGRERPEYSSTFAFPHL